MEKGARKFHDDIDLTDKKRRTRHDVEALVAISGAAKVTMENKISCLCVF